MKARADYLFEASWEVCNKVGGIYTVVKSKAKLLKENYKNYFLIGPYFEKKAQVDFTEKNAPTELKAIFSKLREKGIICHYGIWNIKGEPNCILIESQALSPQKDQFKKLMWDNFQIDSLNSNWDFEEPLLWSMAVGMLLEEIPQAYKTKKVVGHFHEWLAGFALLYLKLQKSPVKTVFTTHATMLGRTLAGSGRPLYSILNQVNPDEEAKRSGINDKYTTEKACALNTDTFTTVSEITSMEAEKLLGRKADVLLLNGLDTEQFPTFEEISVKHRISREIMREFLSYYFFPYYSFDLEQSLNIFIVGRFEYKNKGLDILLSSLSRLNERLKKENFKKTILVFFWVPREVHSTHTSLSNSKMNYLQLKDFIDDQSEILKNHLINHLLSCPIDCLDDPSEISKDLFDKEFMKEAKRIRLNFAKQGNPLLITHHLPNETNDAMLNEFRKAGLNNAPDDKVKVIDYPIYLTGVDGLLDLNYYDAILGCHLGVFPSYYEPWGYTPLESAALGVPAVTTDLAGFGRFIKDKNKKGGIFVLKRMNKSDDQAVEQFVNILLKYCKMSKKSRVEQKMIAKELSTLADWNIFINYYIEAHNLALKNKQTKIKNE